MLRLHPTTIMLTGDDISLAMDHMHSSKANSAETSLSSLASPQTEQPKRPLGIPSRIHKELQTLLADEEDCDRIQKDSGSNIQNDELDGANESSSSHSFFPSEMLVDAEDYPDAQRVLPAIPIYQDTEDSSPAASSSHSISSSYLANLHSLDGSHISNVGEGEDLEWDSGSSTPLLGPSEPGVLGPGNTCPLTPPEAPTLTGVQLRGGASSGSMSPEYYITSTCPEFVGPCEPFSLLSLYNDPSRLSTMVHPPTPVPVTSDGSAPRNTTGPEPTMLIGGAESRPFHRRGLGMYDDASNLEYSGSVFSPFTYSPEEPAQDDMGLATASTRASVPSPPDQDWEDGERGDQEGGRAWDMMEPRV